MDERQSIVILPDGRRLAYQEYGNRHGTPLLLFHGLPGSRLQRHPDAKHCHMARIITMDRPGFGGSDPLPDREYLDWPHDVSHLADHLGLEDFSICAWSGGGPFGLACAYALPERVKSLVLASSVAPLKNGKLLDEMLLTNRLLLRVARDAPFLLGAPITLMGYLLSWAPEHRLDGLSEQLCPRDQELLKRDSLREIMLADMDEAIRQGYEAGQQELNLIAQPWGFSLEEIHTPATVIHGQEDAIIPPAMGRSLAAKLPHSTLIEREEEGHFLLFEHWRAVVRMALGQAKNRVLIGH